MKAVTESELSAAALAPRVTLEQVMASIKGETVTVLPDGTTTIVQLALAGGRFSALGKSSCVSKENFNPEIGASLAKKDAVGQIWPLLGFELAQKLALIDAAGPATGAIVSLLGSRPLTYVGTKVVRGVPMSRQTYNDLRGWVVPDNEDGSDAGYLVEYTDGGKTNFEGFAGYISWSPKCVFERTYTVAGEPKVVVTSFLERLEAEEAENSGRLDKLTAFLATDVFKNLTAPNQKDLVEQRSIMEDLQWVHRRRIRRLTGVSGQ